MYMCQHVYVSTATLLECKEHVWRLFWVVLWLFPPRKPPHRYNITQTFACILAQTSVGLIKAIAGAKERLLLFPSSV